MKPAVLTFACLVIAASSGPPEAVKKDLAALEGDWTMVSGQADGQPMPDEMLKTAKRVSKAGETTVTMGAQMFLKAKYTIDPSKNPKTIDYDMTDGFTKGKKQFGIYKIDADTVTFCFASPEKDRPKEFTSPPGSGNTLSVWKKEKK